MGRSKNRKKTRLGSIQKYTASRDIFGDRFCNREFWSEIRLMIWSGWYGYVNKVMHRIASIVKWDYTNAIMFIGKKDHHWHCNLNEVNDILTDEEYYSLEYYCYENTPVIQKRRQDKIKAKYVNEKRTALMEWLKSNIKNKAVMRYGELRDKGLLYKPESLNPEKDKDIIEYLKSREELRKKVFAEFEDVQQKERYKV